MSGRFKPSWLVVLVSVFVCANPAHADAGSRVMSMVRAADLQQTAFSLAAVDADRGEVLFAVNADQSLIPASNAKLITSAAALGILGPEFMFQTDLRTIRHDDQPTDLVIVGDGDPGFGDPKLLADHGFDVDQLLTAWVEAVEQADVTEIAELIVDDRVFDRQFVHPDWPEDQLHRWYCAQVSGLNFHDNCIEIYPQPTRPGLSPRVLIQPRASFVSVVNRAMTSNADTLWVGRRPDSNVLTLRGKVKTRRTVPISVTVHDPAMFFAQLLAERLANADIEVGSIRRAETTERLEATATLHRVQTTLPLVLARCNKDSQNLFAEALIKRMGHKMSGAPGSWNNGAAAVRRYLHQKLGARGAGVDIADGSGMSRANRVSARLLVELLIAMHHDEEVGEIYRNSLSVGGEDGTLKSRFRDDFAGTVYGKSGYINEVSTLSGYVVYLDHNDEPTRTIAFSLLFNEFKPPVYAHQIKHVQNQIVRLIDDVAAPASADTSLGG